MKVLGVTQGAGINVFVMLAEMLGKRFDAFEASAYVSDSLAYKSIPGRETLFHQVPMELLFEWEITSAGLRRDPDWHFLKQHEPSLGDPVLWNVLLADRRLFFGRACKFRQDYSPRFNYRQMGGILTEAVEKTLAFVEKVKPDVIIGFGMATFGDYLFHRIAKSRGIPYLLLKSTKIGNYVSLNDDAISLSSHISEFMNNPDGLADVALAEADVHIRRIRERGVKYEGALKSPSRLKIGKGVAALATGALRQVRTAADSTIRNDNHVDSALTHAWHTYFRQPLSAAYIRRRLRNNLIGLAEAENSPPFVFYPLHFEPEVSIQVFGRPFQNQIELVRNLALSLPAGMVVVVKEHPRSVGFRPLGYYQKLLDIPNVKLADPLLQTHALIRHATFVAVISGSTGLEAAICGKPVLSFGIPTYNSLSQTMIRHVTDLHTLGVTIRDLLANHKVCEDALRRYVASHIEGSVPVDLYSVLLGKAGRFSEGREEITKEQRREQDYARLSDYVVRRISEVCEGNITS